jgi:hypothetical protein
VDVVAREGGEVSEQVEEVDRLLEMAEKMGQEETRDQGERLLLVLGYVARARRILEAGRVP